MGIHKTMWKILSLLLLFAVHSCQAKIGVCLLDYTDPACTNEFEATKKRASFTFEPCEQVSAGAFGVGAVYRHVECAHNSTTLSITFHSNPECTATISAGSFKGMRTSGCSKLNDAEWSLLGLSGRAQYYMQVSCNACPALPKPQPSARPEQVPNTPTSTSKSTTGSTPISDNSETSDNSDYELALRSSLRLDGLTLAKFTPSVRQAFKSSVAAGVVGVSPTDVVILAPRRDASLIVLFEIIFRGVNAGVEAASASRSLNKYAMDTGPKGFMARFNAAGGGQVHVTRVTVSASSLAHAQHVSTPQESSSMAIVISVSVCTVVLISVLLGALCWWRGVTKSRLAVSAEMVNVVQAATVLQAQPTHVAEGVVISVSPEDQVSVVPTAYPGDAAQPPTDMPKPL